MSSQTSPSSSELETASPLCVVSTEGVEFSFRWDEFAIGANVFIPCLGTKDVIRQVRRSANNYGVTVRHKVGIRNGKWGVGFWRVL